jgi:hypothetical protein
MVSTPPTLHTTGSPPPVPTPCCLYPHRSSRSTSTHVPCGSRGHGRHPCPRHSFPSLLYSVCSRDLSCSPCRRTRICPSTLPAYFPVNLNLGGTGAGFGGGAPQGDAFAHLHSFTAVKALDAAVEQDGGAVAGASATATAAASAGTAQILDRMCPNSCRRRSGYFSLANRCRHRTSPFRESVPSTRHVGSGTSSSNHKHRNTYSLAAAARKQAVGGRGGKSDTAQAARVGVLGGVRCDSDCVSFRVCCACGAIDTFSSHSDLVTSVAWIHLG